MYFPLAELRTAASRIDFRPLQFEVDGGIEIQQRPRDLRGGEHEFAARGIALRLARQQIHGGVEIGGGLLAVARREVLFGALAQGGGIGGIRLHRFGKRGDGRGLAARFRGLLAPSYAACDFFLSGFWSAENATAEAASRENCSHGSQT